ncbi:hypothetical protein ACLOJK_002377 [Asimina triloba]
MAKRSLSDREMVEEERGEEEENESRSSAGDDCDGKTLTSTSSPNSQQLQTLRCQADDCDADLGSAKRYHQRHKVCEKHAKAAVVVVGGVHQRYCQQCSSFGLFSAIEIRIPFQGKDSNKRAGIAASRFHEISQFDDSKRSCRERLAGHNERRRKVPPDQQMEDPGRVPAVLQVKDGTHAHVPVVKNGPWKEKGSSEVIKIALPMNPTVKHFQIRQHHGGGFFFPPSHHESDYQSESWLAEVSCSSDRKEKKGRQAS